MINDIKQIIAHTTPKEWAEDVAALLLIAVSIPMALIIIGALTQ